MHTKHLSTFTRGLLFAVAGILLSAAAVSAGPAQFVIVNLNAPGVGFNDPTPAAPVGGNTGTTLGQQRLIAFEHAARLWSARLDSAVPIRIRAQFASLAPGRAGKCRAGFGLSRLCQRPFAGHVVPRRPREQARGHRPGPRHRRHQREFQHQLQLLPGARRQPRAAQRSRHGAAARVRPRPRLQPDREPDHRRALHGLP